MSTAVVAALLTAAARGAEPGGATSPTDPVDAGLLADLDVLDSADYRRDREAAGRRRLLERLPLLEAEGPPGHRADSPGASPPAPTGAARPPSGASARPASEEKR